jgi:glycosyltransferase involved in cell wall biosynthesis
MADLISGKKIKVAWFASGFVGRQASGTAQAAKKIINNLIKNHVNEIQVVLIAKNEDEVKLIQDEKLFSDVEIILLPKVCGKKFKSARQFYKFCIFRRQDNIDILHYSVPRVYPFFWFFPAKKIICTFHAGGDVTAPRDYFVLSRELYNFIIKKQWRKFAAIIADSEFAAVEIENAYSIPKDFITIIYLGTDNLWGQVYEEVDRDLNSVVVIGRWQRYKNLHTVINSFKKFEIPKNSDLRLKVIGKSGLKDNRLILDALEGFPENQIELIEYLSDLDLAREYRRASVVFHPSINEGFGLPAFEAFGEGSRLIAHNETPANQILNSQAGVIFDNLLDETKIIETYRKILKQNFGNIDQRRIFIESIGATWASSTKNYVGLYQDVLRYAI